MTSNKLPVICLTFGDPSGIGPEIIIKSLQDLADKMIADFIIIGDSFVFNKIYSDFNYGFKYKQILSVDEIDFTDSGILLFDLKNIASEKFQFGCIRTEYGKASIEYIELAHSLIQKNKACAIVTGPINKYSIKKAGLKYYGHTEFLASLSGTKQTAMMLTGGPLSVVLATIHMPLSDAIKAIKKDKIFQLIKMVDEYMNSQFGVSDCKIGVCALNPHAGESGILGKEEDIIIIPAVKKAKEQGINVLGPYPADALFYKAYKGEFNVVIAMYHDQGLIPVKMLARNESVNITLGLPFIRTSPAHGTAFDIAGKNTADHNSFLTAINTAVSMSVRKKCTQ